MASQPLPPLPSGAVTSIPDAITRMHEIEAALPPGDGLACFNRMYHLVTDAVKANVRVGLFADPTWMSDLDVVFGNLYLDAVRASIQAPDQAARAWAVLLERRSDASIRPRRVV